MRKQTIFATLLGSALTLGSTNTGQAALLAYDGFDYDAGAVAAANSTGGTGWSGNWGDITVSSPGLSHGALEVTGNKLASGALRPLSTSVDSGILWISFIAQTGTGYVNIVELLRDWDPIVAVGRNWYNQYGIYASDPDEEGPNLESFQNTTVDAENTQVFLVARVAFNTVMNVYSETQINETIHLWVNPSLASEPTLGSADATIADVADIGTIVRIRISNNGGGNSVDEVRLGTTFAAVTPVPEPTSAGILGLIGLAACTVRRHRRI